MLNGGPEYAKPGLSTPSHAEQRPRVTPGNNEEALLGVRGEGREGGKHPSRGEGLVSIASKRLVTQRVGGLYCLDM